MVNGSTTSSPTVIVLAGPNGAGKTTAARTVLAETLRVMNFVNADVIAQGLSGFDPESMALAAGRIMLQRLHDLAQEKADFAFESTVAGLAYRRWFRSLLAEGYQIHLFYFWLASPDLAVSRVAERVRQGGHSIPETTIRTRYQRSIDNFFQVYSPLATTWEVYDNSLMGQYRIIAESCFGDPPIIHDSVVWHQILKGVPNE